MKKTDALNAIYAATGTSNPHAVSVKLGITPQSIYMWPAELGKSHFRNLVGVFAAKGIEPPPEILKALQGAE